MQEDWLIGNLSQGISSIDPRQLPLQPTRKLKDCSVVIAENPHLTDPNKLKSLALILCKDSLLGDEVLKMSTVTGKRCHPLCPEKLRDLKTVIRSIADPAKQLSDEQFMFTWKGIMSHIGEYCKRLCSKASKT